MTAAIALLFFAAVAADSNLHDADFYRMPKLFHLDEYTGCLATGGVYCMGSFELTPPAHTEHPLYDMMVRYSSDYVDHYNHTQLHRGLCASRCTHAALDNDTGTDALWPTRFSRCVNESTWSEYGLWARLSRLEYCETGPPSEDPPLSTAERAFAAAFAAVVVITLVSTALDLFLPDHLRKGAEWSFSWSLRVSWATLTHSDRRTTKSDEDLRPFDGLRVIAMLCVIIEHVCWLATLSYVADTRFTETNRRHGDVMIMTNSTLVVQVFFLMSSFLLAHKLLREQEKGQCSGLRTCLSTALNRFIRISPSYFAVVWFASSWWSRSAGMGPQWAPLVGNETQVCKEKWWTHLLYLNNIIYPHDKCLIQTWYLAADMQLYLATLGLTLGLRGRRVAVPLLCGLLAAAVTSLFALAYSWSLVPTFIMHSPEWIRAEYRTESSFNVLYQSPLANAPGALVGLLLACVHRDLVRAGVRLNEYKWFRWVSVAAAPAGVLWVAWSPRLVAQGAPPPRLPAALLAATERTVFSLFIAVALLGAMHRVKSPWRTWLSGRAWSVPARLSFGALLLHLPLYKTYLAANSQPFELNRNTALLQWFGLSIASYVAAVPLALLVELPAQRLHRVLTRPKPSPVSGQDNPAADVKRDINN